MRFTTNSLHLQFWKLNHYWFEKIKQKMDLRMSFWVVLIIMSSHVGLHVQLVFLLWIKVMEDTFICSLFSKEWNKMLHQNSFSGTPSKNIASWILNLSSIHSSLDSDYILVLYQSIYNTVTFFHALSSLGRLPWKNWNQCHRIVCCSLLLT